MKHRTHPYPKYRLALDRWPCWLLALALPAAGAMGAEVPSAAAPRGWSFPASPVPRVHLVRGSSYYDREYRLEEILAAAGVNLFTTSTQADRGTSQYGSSPPDAGWLCRYPDPLGKAMDHHVVIVANVGARAFGKNEQVLVDFVKHGGAALFLCASDTFGDQSKKSALADLAPLEFPPEGPWRLDIEQVSEGIELKPGPDYPEDKLPGEPSEHPPRVYSYYPVKPKAGAKVLLVAGDDHPILIAHDFGQGRVAVLAATCRGYPKQDQVPFWRWPQWPGLLGATVRQLAESAARAPHGLAAGDRQVLQQARREAYDLLDGIDPAGSKRFEARLREAAARCHDQPTADLLLDAVAQYPPAIPAELGTEIGQSVARWVGEDQRKQARRLIESGDVGKTVLGLIVMGAVGSPDALAMLEQFHTRGAPQSRSGVEFSLGTADPGTVEGTMQAAADARQIRRAAVMGLGYLGSPDALPVVRRAVAASAVKGRFDPDKQADAIEPVHRDYQNALMSALLCGDVDAAGPVVDCLLGNLAVIPRIEGEQGERRAAVDWQQQLYRRLTGAPDRVLPALAKRIAAEQSRDVTAIALAAFGGKSLPDPAAEVLGQSSVAAVAALGERKD